MNVALKVKAHDPFAAITQALLRPMGIDGLFARTELYEKIVEGLGRLVSHMREPDVEALRFPPVMSRRQLETSGYLNSFPHLLGCVNCLQGTDAEIGAAVARFEAGGDWTSALSTADTVLTPAACYPVYPMAAARGAVPASGLCFDVACDCFRHEPSRDLDRMQSFRMREFVCIGAPKQVVDFRQSWMSKASQVASRLGLAWRIDQASDPFFGRGGQLLASSQVEASLKFELLVPLRPHGPATACMSFNYHKDHFARAWDLRTDNGEVAHTGCTAFGIDRLALALFVTQGLEPAKWPADVRDLLGL